jgi:hypothetical protein
MAYLRAYRARAAMGTVGDPGFGSWFKRATRVPKSIRKFQPGKALARLAPTALSVIPGVGPVLGALVGGGGGSAAPEAALAAGGASPELMGLIMQLRALGIPVGDPGWMDVAKSFFPKVGQFLTGGKSPVGRAILGGVASGIAGGAIGALLPGGGMRAPRGARGYRRMNPGNVKALRRSMRRVESFAKLAKQTISFTHQTRMKKRGRKR